MLLQPFTGARNRWITQVGAPLRRGDTVDVDLTDESRSAPGQVVEFGPRTFSRLEIEIRADTAGRLDHYDGLSAVGFAEVGIEDVRVDEVLRLPTGLLDATGATATDHDLAVVMTRARTDPANAVRSDEETHLARRFELPAGRAFTLAVEGRLADDVTDDVVDRVLGRPGVDAGAVTVSSSSRLPGDPGSGGAAALDGDPSTAWQPAFLASEGAWLSVSSPGVVSFDRLDLQVVDDGRHSVPSRLRIEADGGPAVVVGVPRSGGGGPVLLPQPVSGRTFRVTVEAVTPVTTVDYYSEQPIALPIGIAELGIPGLTVAPPPAAVPDECRSGLLTVDGEDVPLAVDGGPGALLAGEAVALRPCGPSGTRLDLSSGTHDIRTTPGRDTGIDVDRIVLRSAAGGGPGPASGLLAADAGERPPAEAAVAGETATGMEVAVTGAEAGEPLWLELGQSFSPAWQASVDGRVVAGPVLLDGFANGWLVDPPAESFTVALRFTPQRWVWAALAVSAAAGVACLVIALWPGRRRVLDTDELAFTVENPWTYPATTPTRRLRVGVLAAVTVGTLIVAGVLVALVAGGLTGVALWWRRGRPLLLIGAPAAVLLTGVAVAAGQVVFAPPVGLRWPTLFEPLHRVGWLAVALFVAEVAVAWVWRRGATVAAPVNVDRHARARPDRDTVQVDAAGPVR